MKKILQLSAVALLFSPLGAQVLESDNFNSYTQGNVGTSANGNSPGQGGIYTTGGSNQDYQIVSLDSMHGNSLQIQPIVEIMHLPTQLLKNRDLLLHGITAYREIILLEVA